MTKSKPAVAAFEDQFDGIPDDNKWYDLDGDEWDGWSVKVSNNPLGKSLHIHGPDGLSLSRPGFKSGLKLPWSVWIKGIGNLSKDRGMYGNLPSVRNFGSAMAARKAGEKFVKGTL